MARNRCGPPLGRGVARRATPGALGPTRVQAGAIRRAEELGTIREAAEGPAAANNLAQVAGIKPVAAVEVVAAVA